jgi:aryl-alcohol dehydrogenase-like predicted oxidoreductase
MALDPGDLSWDELALRFTLSTPGVSSAITGSRRLEHMRQNLDAAAKGPLPAEVYGAVRDAFRRQGASWSGKI